MPQGDVEVVYDQGTWYVRIEAEGTQVSEHETREQAIDAGRAEAKQRQVELIVHNADGRIGKRDSEGHDPSDVPG